MLTSQENKNDENDNGYVVSATRLNYDGPVSEHFEQQKSLLKKIKILTYFNCSCFGS